MRRDTLRNYTEMTMEPTKKIDRHEAAKIALKSTATTFL